VGKKGAYLNAGIPGSGIYSREKLGTKESIDPQQIFKGKSVIIIKGIIWIIIMIFFLFITIKIFSK